MANDVATVVSLMSSFPCCCCNLSVDSDLCDVGGEGATDERKRMRLGAIAGDG